MTHIEDTELQQAIEGFGIYIANQYGGFEGYEEEDYAEINKIVHTMQQERLKAIQEFMTRFNRYERDSAYSKYTFWVVEEPDYNEYIQGMESLLNKEQQ